MAQAKAAAKAESVEVVTIKPANIQQVDFKIVGTQPYVQLAFGEKVRNLMAEKMRAGTTARNKKSREARDFDVDFQNALHYSTSGQYCIPAGAFRNAMISACRLCGFKMTLAKLSVFVEADDIDALDGTPVVYLEGEPEPVVHHVRNATGVADLRVRAMFREWSARLRVSYDADQFTSTDVANLLSRVGQQVGIGEGRPDSKSSAGMGWGTFRLA